MAGPAVMVGRAECGVTKASETPRGPPSPALARRGRPEPIVQRPAQEPVTSEDVRAPRPARGAEQGVGSPCRAFAVFGEPAEGRQPDRGLVAEVEAGEVGDGEGDVGRV